MIETFDGVRQGKRPVPKREVPARSARWASTMVEMEIQK